MLCAMPRLQRLGFGCALSPAVRCALRWLRGEALQRLGRDPEVVEEPEDSELGEEAFEEDLDRELYDGDHGGLGLPGGGREVAGLLAAVGLQLGSERGVGEEEEGHEEEGVDVEPIP